MPGNLASFLADQLSPVVETVTWGALSLRLASYLSTNLPPRAAITSVRAVVVRQDEVLVVRDPESIHILPGGRCEPGESLEQTLLRELLEETGWTVSIVDLLGFRHFHHLGPKPPDYRFPYPDFCQIVYVARAGVHMPHMTDENRYELEARFRPAAAVQALDLTPGEQLFLGGALARVRGRSNVGPR